MTRRRRWGRPFNEVPVENSPIHEGIRLEGRVTILVSYQVREQRIDVDVPPGPQGGRDPIGDVFDVNHLMVSLNRRPIDSDSVPYGDDDRATLVLKEYAEALSVPEFAALMRGNLSILESARAAMRSGPNTPRYEWPDPFLGYHEGRPRRDPEDRQA